ncbi:hypothetical protein ACWD0J_07275 [Streptomyces sp. NPDC003011]
MADRGFLVGVVVGRADSCRRHTGTTPAGAARRPPVTVDRRRSPPITTDHRGSPWITADGC